MDRRSFVGTAAGALLVRAFPANAQPANKVPGSAYSIQALRLLLRNPSRRSGRACASMGMRKARTSSSSAGTLNPSSSG